LLGFTLLLLKKYLVISFLILLVLPFYVSCAFLFYKKYDAKSEVKERILKGMDKKDLVVFAFSKLEFQSLIADEKEFQYEGVLYDLVEVKETGGLYQCWCWLDEKESELNGKLSLLVEQAMGDESGADDGEKVLSDYFDFLYCCTASTIELSVTDFQEQEKSFYVLSYSFIYSCIFLVPPEIVVV
jgi:hypothetical protein